MVSPSQTTNHIENDNENYDNDGTVIIVIKKLRPFYMTIDY